MIATQLLLGIVSTAALAAMLHYVFTAAMNPRKFLGMGTHPNMRDRTSLNRGIYLSLVFIGFAVVLFTGFKTLLFWIPNSWSSYTDGKFQPVKDFVAAVLATLVLPLFNFIDSTARNRVAVETLQTRINELSRGDTKMK